MIPDLKVRRMGMPRLYATTANLAATGVFDESRLVPTAQPGSCGMLPWAAGLCLLLIFAEGRLTFAAESALPAAVEVRRYDAPEATQAVAVDGAYFYAIGDDVIAKYAKSTGTLCKRWKASDDVPLEHLNSGIVQDGKLYAAHSNYPHYPDASSVEIWDTETLEHVDSHSFGIYEGSLTWIDWHDESWWAVFAHYTEKINDDPYAKDARWTSLVRFDPQWHREAGWTFPEEVIARFQPDSCSGGTWESDRLYCTGHDRGELYELVRPEGGATLRLVRTIRVPITGQGIAWDRDEPRTLYGIDRPRRQVVVARLPFLTTAELNGKIP